MGVDIGGIFEKQELSFAEIKGKIAIDAFNALYQFLTIIRQRDGTPLMDASGKITSHLSGLFYRTCNLLEKGIQPVYVFDGEPSDLKRKTIEERRERKRHAEEELLKAREEGRLEDVMVYAQQTARLTEEMVEESKHLLKLMGVPVVQARSEGEAECAHLCSKGFVDAAASQDYDALLFGAPVFIRNLTIAGRRKLPRKTAYVDVLPERIDLKANLERLGITRQQLVWIAILIGTDFNEGIKGIGAKKGLKLVKECKNMDVILKKIGKEVDYGPVEELFLEPEVAGVKKEHLQFREPDRDKIMEYMLSKSFSAERVSSALKRAFAEPANSRQSSLQKWT